MKTYLKFIVLYLAWLMFAPVTAQDDKTAIKAVIEKETNSFFNLDKNNWEASWIQAPYSYWSYSDSSGTSFIEGWDNINKNFGEYFRTKIPSRTIDVANQPGISVERVWKEIRVYRNGAYAYYTQKVKDDIIYRDETSQTRILEKKDGKWKIVYVGAIAKYPIEE